MVVEQKLRILKLGLIVGFTYDTFRRTSQSGFFYLRHGFVLFFGFGAIDIFPGHKVWTPESPNARSQQFGVDLIVRGEQQTDDKSSRHAD